MLISRRHSDDRRSFIPLWLCRRPGPPSHIKEKKRVKLRNRRQARGVEVHSALRRRLRQLNSTLDPFLSKLGGSFSLSAVICRELGHWTFDPGGDASTNASLVPHAHSLEHRQVLVNALRCQLLLTSALGKRHGLADYLKMDEICQTSLYRRSAQTIDLSRTYGFPDQSLRRRF